jgi:hypothetical protein
MEELIRARLLASSAVTALAGDRIDFGSNAQGAENPRICMWTISDAEGLSLEGPDGLSQGRVQVDCYSDTYSSAKGLSRAVRAALDGHSGGGLQLVRLIGTRDTREGGTNEADRPFRVSLDFATFYNPAG